MPRRRTSGSPRATRAMIDLLYSVASSGDVVGSWDLTGQAEGLVLRVRSREVFGAESEALEVADRMVKGLLPADYEVVSTSVAGRDEGTTDGRWRGLAEMVVRSSQ